jgi:hypothetical protein
LWLQFNMVCTTLKIWDKCETSFMIFRILNWITKRDTGNFPVSALECFKSGDNFTTHPVCLHLSLISLATNSVATLSHEFCLTNLTLWVNLKVTDSYQLVRTGTAVFSVYFVLAYTFGLHLARLDLATSVVCSYSYNIVKICITHITTGLSI